MSVADLIPTEDLFRPIEFSNVRMSPDGLYVAAIARTPAKPDGQNLIVMKLADRSVKVLTGYPDDEVTQFWWVSDERLLFELTRDSDSPTKSADYLGTYAIDRDGSRGTRIHVPFQGDSRGGRGVGGSGTGSARDGIRKDFEIMDIWWENPDHILVQKINQCFRFPDVYKVNVNTGHMRKQTVNDVEILDWHADYNGKPRAGYSAGSDRDDLIYDIVYRPENSEEWKSITTSTMGDFTLYGFDQDNEHIYLSSRNGGDRMKLYRANGETGELGKPLVSDPDYDVNGQLTSTRSGKPLFFRYQTDKPRTLFFDKERFFETSPINHVKEIQAPLLIIHGVFDPILPVEHARKLVGKLKSAGKEFEYQEKRYEGHGFRTPVNQVDLYEMIDVFLKEKVH